MKNRIHLSVEDVLFTKLDKAAKQGNTTVNLLIIDILQGIYFDSVPIDYGAALSRLIEETKNLDDEQEEFILLELPSFSAIDVVQAEKGTIKPSTIRARLGKAFNEAVRRGSVPWVKRAATGDGTLRFRSRAALYVIDKSVLDGMVSDEGEKVEKN